MKFLLNKVLSGFTAQSDAITLGGVPLPHNLEPLHCLLAESIGTGKTTLVDKILSTAVPRGDKVIVCDPSAHHLSRCWNTDDTVLNTFDRRSPGWTTFNEVRKDYDYDRLAKSIAPDALGADRQWHRYAQVLCAETIRALVLRGEGSSAQLMHWLTIAKADELATLLAGTPAQGVVRQGCRQDVDVDALHPNYAP